MVSAKAIIVNSDGKVLVLTNSHMGVNPDLAYSPDLPGGTVEPGETADEALVREVQEEIGINISDAPRKQLAEYYHPKGLTLVIYLVWANVRDVSLREEHCAFSWFGLTQAQRLGWWDGYQDLFTKVETALNESGKGVEFPDYIEATAFASA